MSRTRLLLWTYGLDVLIVSAAISSAVGTVLREDRYRLNGSGLWFEALAITATVLTLLLHRHLAFVAPVAVWLSCAALSFLDGQLVTSQPGIFAAGLGAALLIGHVGAAQARIGLAIVLGCAAMVVYNEPAHHAGDIFVTPAPFGIGWLVGYALRERTERTEAAEERAARAERDREAATRVAVAEERARIARELHDVVAHAVSVMVLQVGAVRHRMTAAQADNSDALRNVEHAGRTALTEMRRLLGAMRREDEQAELEPHPGLAALDGLLDSVRAAGLQARLHIHGEPVELPPGLDLSAYRIVQEALTNVIKHAYAHQADVEVRYEPHDLHIAVSDDGGGLGGVKNGTRAGAVGHGLVGLTERVKIYGGQMSASEKPGGGFAVHARLPLESAVS